MAYIANTKITVNKRTYHAGEVVKEKISPAEVRFLRREGYVKEEKTGSETDARTEDRKTARKKAESKVSGQMESDQ